MKDNSLISTVIVDDEEAAVDNLCFELRRHEGIRVEGIAGKGSAGIRLIEKKRPDLVFLDVELPDMMGMDVANHLHNTVNWGMQIVFYTAYDKYLIDALRNFAFDFLLKPIDPKELDVVIQRVRLNFDTDQGTLQPPLPVGSPVVTEKSFMVVTPTGDLRILRVSEIGYFRYLSARKIWEAVLTNGIFIPLRRNTSAENLCAYDASFVQVHQSFIINLNYLVMVQGTRCIMYPPFDGVEEVQVSKKFRKEMIEKFYQL